jgi:hypothetical protein
VFDRNPRFYSVAVCTTHLLNTFALETVCVATSHPNKCVDMHTPTSQALASEENTATPTYEGLNATFPPWCCLGKCLILQPTEYYYTINTTKGWQAQCERHGMLCACMVFHDHPLGWWCHTSLPVTQYLWQPCPTCCCSNTSKCTCCSGNSYVDKDVHGYEMSCIGLGMVSEVV